MSRDPNREGRTKDINILPSPQTEHDPQLTKFVLDIGAFYETSGWEDWRSNQSRKRKALEKIAHYLSDNFIKVLKKELKID